MKITGKFANAEAYDRNTGRFSRMLAGAFIEFAGVKDDERLLDVGCGTGALAFTAAALTHRSEIVGIDPSASFIEHARSQANDPRLRFDVGSALTLPYPDSSFAKCLSLLVIQFVPDVRRAISEMRRVTRKGGTVAACVWSRDDDPLHTVFWDSAAEVDPGAEGARDSRAYSQGQLSSLWIEGGFTGVEETALMIAPEFGSFEAYWKPLVRGQGPSSSYLESLSPDKQEVLRLRVRERVLGKGPDRPFTLKAKAWAVRGLC
ncbi:MAG: methyltransferase domain-containing protein [Deltaproteobacteria bacterium]|nr:methyltransferase domain-containing protein [Deltaproteobacteria bacterium]MBI2211746.1 methyltransferase domain-containing protein [Deltaproteobacteria bacterium]MBI2539348.1 methyltransferase domain-containing protein [Deltaproteobacteria bacterium]